MSHGNIITFHKLFGIGSYRGKKVFIGIGRPQCCYFWPVCYGLDIKVKLSVKLFTQDFLNHINSDDIKYPDASCILPRYNCIDSYRNVRGRKKARTRLQAHLPKGRFGFTGKPLWIASVFTC